MKADSRSISTSVSPKPLNILVLEDDELLRERILKPKLTQFGFEVSAVGYVSQLWMAIAASKPDIVLLDIGLPDSDGFEVARRLRTDLPATGIVMLTGRSAAADRVRGLNDGADAYLAKPIDIDLLVATLFSVARRLQIQAPAVVHDHQWSLTSDGWILVSPTGSQVTLSRTERRLIEVFMKYRSQVISRDVLIAALTDNIHTFDPHRLDSLIHRLRRKVLASAGQPLPLNVVHGAGYLLAED
ncbi:response regulator transcription factor [Dyella sp. C11]|uniref:response regulator transcription factor n=1 Tax=Dyella sp. C11 TaxID=2126991 RepID=UPI001E634464|nr:response regulator transcription factor [Dyella sp. C11]